MFATKQKSSSNQDVRYACELLSLGPALQKDVRSLRHRFAKHIGPNVTAMTTLWDRFGDNHQLVAGTEEGFVVWMDRTDTKLCMMGPDSSIHGASSMTLGSNASGPSQYLETPPSADSALSGPRGPRIRFLEDVTLVENSAVVLGAVGTTLILDLNRTVDVRNGGSTILGATRPSYRSKWFDLAVPELDKKSVLLDISRADQSSGSLTVTTHKNFADATVDTLTLDLTEPLGHLPTTVQGAVLQFRLSEPFASSGTEFEIIDIIWRVQITDSW